MPDLRCRTVTTCCLPCPATATLDEDLFFVKDGQLVGFGITINMVKVKYYSLNGELMFVRVFPWEHQQFEIEFDVVDLFCVRHRKEKGRVRVFYIDSPENYIEIAQCDKFFPAKLGRNVYSDGSGYFAVKNSYRGCLEVYSLIAKYRTTEIRLKDDRELSDVFFGRWATREQTDRRLFLNLGNKSIGVYSVWGG
jgi:hypothetical protein